MPVIKFERLVTFSSEDPEYKASNLLDSDGKKKWKCKTPGEKQLTAILQLEKPSVINSVDIGNDGSAFVEIQVGRQAEPEDSFEVLLASSSFMSPLESRNESNMNRVRMFGPDKLNSTVSGERWDRLKIVCIQPFNKHIKYGLSFVTISGPSEEIRNKNQTVKLGAFSLKVGDENDDGTARIGSYFAKRNSLNVNVLKNKESLTKEKPKEPFYREIKLNNCKDQKRRLDKIVKLPQRNALPGEYEDKNEEGGGPQAKIERTDELEKGRKPKEREKAGYVKQSTTESVRKIQKKPFKRLLEGVIFTISGYQNPLRSEIRSMAIEMGACYKGNWDDSCTHLVCAFANTPKFNEVRNSKNNRKFIVKKDWIEKCYSSRKRLPWRRYCLDYKDAQAQESEDEIWEEIEDQQQLSVSTNNDDEKDTDDEIETIHRDHEDEDEEEEEEEENGYDADTDVEQQPDIVKEVYDAETDEEKEEDQKIFATPPSFPELPSYFENCNFFIHGSLSEEGLEKSLKRIIIGAGGNLYSHMTSDVHYIITESPSTENLHEALKCSHKIKLVKPKFIIDCVKSKKKLFSSGFSIPNA